MEKDFQSDDLKSKFDSAFFKNLYQELREISLSAIAPISHAFYSCILVFENNGRFLVHAGSNIDPLKKENLKNIKFRNCAEKQASLSAFEEDDLMNDKLKILFLFRLDNKIKKLSSEKLLPCKDCYEKYIVDLYKNNGVLVLVSEEMESQDFLLDQSKASVQISFDDEFRFVFLKAEDLKQLNLEQGLGSNIV